MGLDRYQIKNMENNWIYFGIFFDDAEKKTLIERAKEMGIIPQGWTIYCDHMTIVFNDRSGKQNVSHLEESLGKREILTISKIGISNRAIAFGVEFLTSNRQAHITISIIPGGKPVESNNIQNWIKLNTQFSIEGRLDVVRPRV